LREVGRAAARGTHRQQEWINPLFLQHTLPHRRAGPVVVATNGPAHTGEAEVASPSAKRRE
jgi:hypothetical protein